MGRPNDVLVARDFITVKLPIGGYSAADLNTPFNLESPPYYTGRLYDPLTGLQVRNNSRHSEQSNTAAHVSHAARQKALLNAEVAVAKTAESVTEIVQEAVAHAEVVELKPLQNVKEHAIEVTTGMEITTESVREIKYDINRVKERPPKVIKSIPHPLSKKGRMTSGPVPVVVQRRNEDGTLCVRKQQHRYNEDSMDVWDFDLNISHRKPVNDFSSRTTPPIRYTPPVKKPSAYKSSIWKPA